jgi:type II secretory pathway pseudopilin PulG
MTLIEILISTMILGILTVIFGTVLPMASLTGAVVSEDTYATTVARQKMEQIKALKYEELTYDVLCQRGVIDYAPEESPYAFTQVDGMQGVLRDAVGQIQIHSVETEVQQIRITIVWTDARSNQRSVALVSQTTDK